MHRPHAHLGLGARRLPTPWVDGGENPGQLPDSPSRGPRSRMGVRRRAPAEDRRGDQEERGRLGRGRVLRGRTLPSPGRRGSSPARTRCADGVRRRPAGNDRSIQGTGGCPGERAMVGRIRTPRALDPLTLRVRHFPEAKDPRVCSAAMRLRGSPDFAAMRARYESCISSCQHPGLQHQLRLRGSHRSDGSWLAVFSFEQSRAPGSGGRTTEVQR